MKAMRITLLAYGSRGDVHPYVALGVGLQRSGHTVRLAAPALFQRHIEGRGLEFAPLTGDPNQLVREAMEKAGGGANLLRLSQVILGHTIPIAVAVIADVRRACLGADAIVHSLLTTMIGHLVAVEQDTPDVSALIYAAFAPTAAFPNPAFPAWPLGGAYNRLTHQIFGQMFWLANRWIYAWLRRRRPELPPFTTLPFDAGATRPTPLLIGLSPQVSPRPADWGPHVYLTGYWFLDAAADWRPPPALDAFLAAGPPPVYVGFGSNSGAEVVGASDIAQQALARAGLRGVLLTGSAGIAPAGLPDYVCPLEDAPFDWLFPRVAATLHHGGVGTTAASLRAGVPTLIVPSIADQYHWGRQVGRLGVGPPAIPRRRLNVENLTEALRQATGDAGMAQRAAELGRRIRAEDGVGRAVQFIEQYCA
jgi:sterol 3beta-glucosyltransferase